MRVEKCFFLRHASCQDGICATLENMLLQMITARFFCCFHWHEFTERLYSIDMTYITAERTKINKYSYTLSFSLAICSHSCLFEDLIVAVYTEIVSAIWPLINYSQFVRLCGLIRNAKML